MELALNLPCPPNRSPPAKLQVDLVEFFILQNFEFDLFLP